MAVFVIIIVIKKEKRRKYALCPCLPLAALSHTHDSHSATPRDVTALPF